MSKPNSYVPAWGKAEPSFLFLFPRAPSSCSDCGRVAGVDRFYDDMAEVDDDAEEDYDDKDRANANELTAMERYVGTNYYCCTSHFALVCFCHLLSTVYLNSSDEEGRPAV